jgi:hypothetical protein
MIYNQKHATFVALASLLTSATAAPAYHAKNGHTSELLAPGAKPPGAMDLVGRIHPGQFSVGCWESYQIFSDMRCWCYTGCALDCPEDMGRKPGTPGKEVHPDWCQNLPPKENCELPTCDLEMNCKDQPGEGLGKLESTGGFNCKAAQGAEVMDLWMNPLEYPEDWGSWSFDHSAEWSLGSLVLAKSKALEMGLAACECPNGGFMYTHESNGHTHEWPCWAHSCPKGYESPFDNGMQCNWYYEPDAHESTLESSGFYLDVCKDAHSYGTVEFIQNGKVVDTAEYLVGWGMQEGHDWKHWTYDPDTGEHTESEDFAVHIELIGTAGRQNKNNDYKLQGLRKALNGYPDHKKDEEDDYFHYWGYASSVEGVDLDGVTFNFKPHK